MFNSNFKPLRQFFVIAALFCALLVVSAMSVNAQTTTFTYQGRLTDGTMPANGSYDMEFRLFDVPTVGSGTQIGTTQTRSAVSVMSGIFTVQLDFGSTPFATSRDRYLEISVKPADGGAYMILAPRQQITSAPSGGRGIRNVLIVMTDSNGAIRTAMSSSFGYYSFADVPAGETYILSARAKRFNFAQPTQVVSVSEEMTEINFIASDALREY